MADQTTISVTEITILSGRKKAFKLKVNDKDVSIPIDEALFTHYQEQFYRPSPTLQQRNKFATLLNLMRAAYIQGQKDANK